VTAPEGNSAEYVYDARSNLLQTTMHAKAGSGLSDRTASATYDALCNVALTETDALGRVTTTAINQTTCLVTSVTGPQVGGSSPVTSFTL